MSLVLDCLSNAGIFLASALTTKFNHSILLLMNSTSNLPGDGGRSGGLSFAGAVGLFLLVVCSASAQGETTLTVGDATYANPILKKEYPGSFFIRHDAGTDFIERRELSESQISQLLQSKKEDGAVDSADGEQYYQKANQLLRREDEGGSWNLGVALMRDAAVAGNAKAQYDWGLILIDAFCCKQDGSAGEDFLRRAADAGERRAIRQLALWERQPEKRQQGLRRAAEAGDGQAMVYLATDGVANEDGGEEGRSWLDKTFSSGDYEGVVSAAWLLVDLVNNAKDSSPFGMTTEELQAKAIEGFRLGIEHGIDDAYCGMAYALRRGMGVEKNIAESDRLLEKYISRVREKASRGSIAARFNLIRAFQITGGASQYPEVLRLATEILDQSNYSGHCSAAAYAGVSSVVEGGWRDPEKLKRAIAWLKSQHSKRNCPSLPGLITTYEAALKAVSSPVSGE